jgi:hypothetical protein
MAPGNRNKKYPTMAANHLIMSVLDFAKDIKKIKAQKQKKIAQKRAVIIKGLAENRSL